MFFSFIQDKICVWSSAGYISFKNEILQKQMEKGEAFRNYLQLLTLMERNIIPNEQQFECPICYMEIEEEEGVLLRECLHSFCRLDGFHITQSL